MFSHDFCLKGRLYTFSTFSAFKIHNSVSLWVKITKKPNTIGRPSLCFAPKQSSNFATECDVINRWIIGIRNKYQELLESYHPPRLNLTVFGSEIQKHTIVGITKFYYRAKYQLKRLKIERLV